MKVVGRAGSQYCAAVLGKFRQAGLIHPDIDDHPGFVEPEVIQFQVEELANRARSTVARDHIRSSDSAYLAIITSDLQGNLLRCLSKSKCFQSKLYGYARMLGRPRAQHRFNRRLGEHHRGNVPQWIGRRHDIDAADELALCPEVL